MLKEMFFFNNNNELLLRKNLVEFALEQKNKKYQWGSGGPDTFDCAGLVWYIYFSLFDIDIIENGIGISTTTQLMTSTIGNLTLYNQFDFNKYSQIELIKPGDVVFFHRQSLNDDVPKVNNRYPGHCGVYLGEDQFLHASRKKGLVVVNNLEDNTYWLKKLVASKNIIDDIKIKIKK